MSSNFASSCQTPPVLPTPKPLELHPFKPALPFIQTCGGWASDLYYLKPKVFINAQVPMQFIWKLHSLLGPFLLSENIRWKSYCNDSENENICMKSAVVSVVQAISLTLDIDEHAFFPINARPA